MSTFVDCLTFADIPVENLVTIYEGRTPYYYDIESLARHYQVSKRLENPSTQIPLEAELKERVLKHAEVDTVSLRINFGNWIYLHSATLIGFVLIEIVSTYQDARLITKADVLCNSISLYNYDLNTRIKTLRKRCFNCVVSIPTSATNLRKLLKFSEKFPGIRSTKIIRSIIEEELEFGTCLKVPQTT